MESVGVTAPLPSPDFWRGRRVLLTGHTGFKGSWTALWLKRLGARTTGFALPPDTDPSLFSLAGVAEDLDSRLGDLRAPEAVAAAVAAADPEIVLHYAAQPLVRRAIADPVETIAVNALGLAHLLAALRDRPALERILVVTSDKVYDNRERGVAFAEDDPLGGKDPYSASKAAAEIIARSFADDLFRPARRGAGDRARRQRHRRRRLFRGPHRPRHHARLGEGRTAAAAHAECDAAVAARPRLRRRLSRLRRARGRRRPARAQFRS